MATSDLIVSKLKAKYADRLTTYAGESFGDLWRLWSQENGSSAYLTGDALLAVYGGSGTFAERELAYWTAYNPGTSGFNKFTADIVNTVDNSVAVSYSPDGFWTVTGSGGAGNDRRIYYLNGSSVTDAEVRLTFDVTSGSPGTGQTGIALRGADNGPAVMVWSNIVFSATGNVVNGVWEYNGTTLQSTNQLANTSHLYGLDIVNGTGDGSRVTVNTKAPHLLDPGDIIGFTGFGAFGQATVLDTPTPERFRFASTTAGSWTGGSYEWVIHSSPRHLAVRLQGTTLTTKQWPVGLDEPSWSDPLRVVTNTLPATLAISGAPPPASGQVGICAAHMGNGGAIRVRDLKITNL